MPIPDVNAWWTQQQQRLPGLGGLPSLAGADAASQWESVGPQRSALYDLYQQDVGNQSQAPPATQGQGQAPLAGAGLPEGGSALGQMLSSLVGASRSSTTPLAGLPSAIGDTLYSYFTNPVLPEGYTGGAGGSAPPGMVWSDELQAFIPQTPTATAPTGGEDGAGGGTPQEGETAVDAEGNQLVFQNGQWVWTNPDPNALGGGFGGF
jgi:hypothetical protein